MHSSFCKKRRRGRVPAVISPAPFLSGGRYGAGEGGEPVNRRADVYRLDSFLARPSVCLPSATTVQLRLPGVEAVMVLPVGE